MYSSLHCWYGVRISLNVIMEENKETQPEEKEETVLSPLDELRQERIKNEETLQKFEEIVDKFETLKMDEVLRGRAEAGKDAEEKPKEPSPEEYARDAVAGKLNVKD